MPLSIMSLGNNNVQSPSLNVNIYHIQKTGQWWISDNQVTFVKWLEGSQFLEKLCLNMMNKCLNSVNIGKYCIKIIGTLSD